jgi:hypothetical protein
MKKIVFLGILLAVFAAFASYAQDGPYVNEAGFHYIDVYYADIINGEIVVDGYVVILDYTGPSRAISIPPSLMGEPPRIGKEAFFDKQLTSVTIPNGITVIEQGAFHTNLLTAITIPNSVTEIGIGAFMYNRLTAITIGNGVKYIGEVTFAGNPITSITIGAGVNINDEAFIGHVEADGFFPNNFAEFYNAQGRLAGTYTRPNARSTVWTRSR